MTRKQKRLVLISSGLAVIGLAVGLVLFALRDNIVFFYGPTELAEKAPAPGARLRLGGLVKQGSLEREGGGERALHRDRSEAGRSGHLHRPVAGSVPRRAGRRRRRRTIGADHVFHADSVLAKHDERYMPREVADALKKQGVWREGESAPSRRAGWRKGGEREMRQWLMIVETGHYALVLALALALVNSVVADLGRRRRRPPPDGDRALGRADASFGFIAYSYFALTYAHVTSDFSLVNVVENSHSLKPLIYKITGVWGNHEGSMLLWVLVLAIFAAAVALSSSNMPADLRANTLAVQSWISAAFLAVHPFDLQSLRADFQIRRWRATTSIRCCRTPASPSIRRCFISAMSASRSPFPSRRRR